MGGASSHDIQDGILSPFAEDFQEQYSMRRAMGCNFRVNHRTWWKEELSSEEEYATACAVLERIDSLPTVRLLAS